MVQRSIRARRLKSPCRRSAKAPGTRSLRRNLAGKYGDGGQVDRFVAINAMLSMAKSQAAIER